LTPYVTEGITGIDDDDDDDDDDEEEEGYAVTRPKIFVYCKSGGSQLKLGHSATPFGLYS